MELNIRPVTLTDAPAILAIYAPYITDTVITFETEVPALEDFTSRIENIASSYPYLVCELDGTVAGYAYASITVPNEKSIGLHKSFGFHEIGTYHNVGYKAGKWLDVIWLEKPLKEYGTPTAL